jgi:hypothetical protein
VFVEQQKTDDPNKPSFKMADLMDPYTSKPLKYFVEIPQELKPVMKFDGV